jgi:outer membrane protein
MKKISVIIISLLTAGIMIGSVNAASFGYIDVPKVFSTYEKTKKAQEQIRKKEQNLQDEIATKQKQVEKAKNKGMSDEDLKDLVKKLEKELDPKRADITDSKQKIMLEIQDDIVKAAEATAKKMGIEIVLDKKALITGGIDITDKVIELLNKK